MAEHTDLVHGPVEDVHQAVVGHGQQDEQVVQASKHNQQAGEGGPHGDNGGHGVQGGHGEHGGHLLKVFLMVAMLSTTMARLFPTTPNTPQASWKERVI